MVGNDIITKYWIVFDDLTVTIMPNIIRNHLENYC
jgi:hypothetical protein